MSSGNPSRQFNFTDILFFIIRWWKKIFLVSVVGAAVSVVVAYLIPPKFQAKAVVFPTSNSSFAGAFLSEITSKDRNQDPLAIGQEDDAEHLLQILESDYVRASVINRFHLMEHYEINPASKGADMKLGKQFESNVKVKRNQYTAIEITVMDRDPQFAADIANAVVAYADTAKTQILKQYADRALKEMELYMAEKQAYIMVLKDSLNALGAKGIIAPDEQVKGLMEQATMAASRGDQRTMAYVDAQIKRIGSFAGDYFHYNRTLVEEAQKMADLRKKYEQAKADVASGIPSNFKVNKAYAPTDKSYPVRWIIVVVSTLAAFLTAFFAFLIYEQVYLPIRQQMQNK